MQKNLIKRLLPHSLLLSLLLHLLFLCTVVLVILHPEEKKKSPQLYNPPIPAYTYTGAITPSAPAAQKQSPPSRTETEISPKNEVESELNKTLASGTLPASPPQKKPMQRSPRYQKSVLEMSQDLMRENQIEANLRRPKNTEPILLIGDEHQIADPLVKLLGRALSAHFNYPKMEGNFGIQGKVLVELIFHPEGYFSDVQIIQSSNNQNFDAAALYAVNQAPKVIGADHFLSKPKYFVVGFVFN